MVEVVKEGMSEIQLQKIAQAYKDLIRSEGWKYFSEFLQTKVNQKAIELFSTASKAEDIRIINQLGRDIELYKYILAEPQFMIDNAERIEKRKE